MVEVGSKINDRLKHFAEICPDIPLSEQVELRKLGNEYLKVLDEMLAHIEDAIDDKHPFYSLLLTDYNNFYEGVAYAKVIINGLCYDNDEIKNRCTKEELEKSYLIYDETYNQIMHRLKECRDKKLMPKRFVFLDWPGK